MAPGPVPPRTAYVALMVPMSGLTVSVAVKGKEGEEL